MIALVNVVIVGAGVMGAQIACEYALAGHDVSVVARDANRAADRIRGAVHTALTHAVIGESDIDASRDRIHILEGPARLIGQADFIVESVDEEMQTKVMALRPIAESNPLATIATNTSSLSVSALGKALEAAERTLGTHYWNPPLLMPLVEVVTGDKTEPERVASTVEMLRKMKKQPVVVHRDIPGFVWNRLQFALLREALELVQDGIADPETVDTIVREGLARRWTYTGPFQTAAAGGSDTFEIIANNIFPHLSVRPDAEGLATVARSASHDLANTIRQRDRGLADLLRKARQDEDR